MQLHPTPAPSEHPPQGHRPRHHTLPPKTHPQARHAPPGVRRDVSHRPRGSVRIKKGHSMPSHTQHPYHVQIRLCRLQTRPLAHRRQLEKRPSCECLRTVCATGGECHTGMPVHGSPHASIGTPYLSPPEIGQLVSTLLHPTAGRHTGNVAIHTSERSHPARMAVGT